MQIQNSFVVSGNWKFYFINDGHFYLNPIINNRDTASNYLPDKINHFAINYMIAESRDCVYLVDLGLGSLPNNIFKRADKSKHIYIKNKLKTITSKKIAAIIFSHLHIDHIGNYLEYNNSSYLENFPGIPCYVSRMEWEFRTSRFKNADDVYKNYYRSLEQNIHLTEDDQDIFPGIKTQFIGGHTPGHNLL
jgi:glyoxylase-like metal-dependent hydrolase (beta-lactamase superfamily II)